VKHAQAATLVSTALKSLNYLKYSEDNSELLQTANGWQGGGQAASMACGEIPCAVEQGRRFALSGK
jgi:hypothetical protein